MKKGNRSKKYDHFWFFFDPFDIDLSNKIDELFKNYHSTGLLDINDNGWYSPTKTYEECLKLTSKEAFENILKTFNKKEG